jgi:hypothetical protein
VPIKPTQKPKNYKQKTKNMKRNLTFMLNLAILLSLTTNGFAQFNKALPENNQSSSSFSVPKHSIGIDLFPIAHNLFAGKMQAYATRTNEDELIYYSSHKPIGLFYNLRLGRERQDVNTFLTFGIQGLYGINQFGYWNSWLNGLFEDSLKLGYKITNSQIGVNVGIRRDYVLSKHWDLSIGTQLFYGRNRLVVDTTHSDRWLLSNGRLAVSFYDEVFSTYQTIFGGSFSMGLVLLLSEHFSIETRLSATLQHTETSNFYDSKRSMTYYFTDNFTDNYIIENNHSRMPLFSNSFAFNSRINIILFYKF